MWIIWGQYDQCTLKESFIIWADCAAGAVRPGNQSRLTSKPSRESRAQKCSRMKHIPSNCSTKWDCRFSKHNFPFPALLCFLIPSCSSHIFNTFGQIFLIYSTHYKPIINYFDDFTVVFEKKNISSVWISKIIIFWSKQMILCHKKIWYFRWWSVSTAGTKSIHLYQLNEFEF